MTKRGEKTAPNKRASAHPPHAEPPAAGPETAQPKGPLLPEKKRPFWERARSELRPIVFGLAVAGLLIVAKNLWVERTVFGQQLDQMGARLLQVRLSDSSGSRVRIVDISSLKPSSPASATGAIVVTDRPELTKYLDLVASAGPRAIGIDLIFDPAPGGTISKEDYNFLNHCLELQQRPKPIPVRVGIYKSIALGPERWLGDPRFKDLGASIIVPFKDEDHKSAPTGSMFRQFRFKVNNKPVTANSLSYSLFLIAQREATNQLKLTKHFDASGREEFEADTPFVINFGLLQKLMGPPSKSSIIKAEDIGSHLSDLRDNIVLIGRATPGEAPDVFTTTASDEPIPGVYIHAAAVYTLMEAPLWEVRGRLSDSIDLLLALVMLVLERWMDHIRGFGSHDKVRTTPEVVVPALLAVLVLMFGVIFVVLSGFYWTDFVAVAITLLIHKPLEAGCHIVWEVVQKSPRLLWRKT
jgi:CHASE2 domain-containing sensor protein